MQAMQQAQADVASLTKEHNDLEAKANSSAGAASAPVKVMRTNSPTEKQA